MNDPPRALMQSFGRSKARNYAAFYKVMELGSNSSNNSVYADADGNIAYFHGNFIPVRDPRFDWRRPVGGSDPATEWKGLHRVSDTLHLFRPVPRRRIIRPICRWIRETRVASTPCACWKTAATSPSTA